MIVPLPDPDGVTVHHVWLLVAVQAEFEVTVKGVVPGVAVTTCVEGVTASVGAAWVTVTTTGVTPLTVTVMLAVLWASVVFCEYVAISVPLPVPDGVTVHHDWLLVAVHAKPVVTLNEAVPAAAETG